MRPDIGAALRRKLSYKVESFHLKTATWRALLRRQVLRFKKSPLKSGVFAPISSNEHCIARREKPVPRRLVEKSTLGHPRGGTHLLLRSADHGRYSGAGDCAISVGSCCARGGPQALHSAPLHPRSSDLVCGNFEGSYSMGAKLTELLERPRPGHDLRPLVQHLELQDGDWNPERVIGNLRQDEIAACDLSNLLIVSFLIGSGTIWWNRVTRVRRVG